MTQKHAEALPAMKGQGREPRPTAWLSAAALTEATAARDPQKEALVSLPAARSVEGQIQQGTVWPHGSRVQVPTHPLVSTPGDFAPPYLPVG